MPINTLPTDSNSKPADGLFDPTTGHVVASKSGTIATSSGGVEYAPEVVNIADPTTPANQLAVNSLGQVAVSNFPAVQSVIGTVSVAQFPSIQPVSGSVDVSDRAARQLGHVIVDLGGAGTNTAPGYTVIQDPTANSHKMIVNADGSINVSGTITTSNPSVGADGAAIPSSSTLVGASDGTNLQQLLVESASNRNLRTGIYSGANEATVTGANALKVDNSAVTQPVSGTITANAGTNLNTSTLALESGGHLASIDTHLPAQGQAAMVASMPVAIASNQSNVNVAVNAALPTGSNVIGALSANQSVNMAQIGGITTQMATADGVTLANVPEFAIGLYNGTTLDRLKTAGSLGDQFTTGMIGAAQFLFNGGSFDRLRTPQVFVTIAAVSITSGSPTAVWTPTGGKKFHLMGYCVTSTVAASIIFKDGTTEIFRVPVTAGVSQVNPGNFGNGYPGTVANQALNFDVTTTGVVSGYVFGTSEF